MAKTVYESTLTAEEIRRRLPIFAKSADEPGWRMGAKPDYYFRFYDRRHFFLILTHPGRSGSGALNQPVFLATLTETEEGTRIEGRFGWEWRRQLITLLLSLILFALIVRSVFLLAVVAAFLIFGQMFALDPSRAAYREEEQAALDFIEQFLLR